MVGVDDPRQPDQSPSPARQGARPAGAHRGNTLRPPTMSSPIRGRADYLAVIEDRIADLQNGHGSMLLIEGPPGIGKSRLLEEVAALATPLGLRPLSSKAFEDQQTVPFAPLFDALVGADPPIVDIATLRELSTASDVRYWVVNDLRESIASAAATAPSVISIDDVHWADNGTVRALRALIARLGRAPVLWTFAMRPLGGRPGVRDAINATAAAQGQSAHHIFLGALDDDAVALIAGDL